MFRGLVRGAELMATLLFIPRTDFVARTVRKKQSAAPVRRSIRYEDKLVSLKRTELG
jgi:hypothetical protein